MNQTIETARVCAALMRIGTRMATEFDQRFAPLGITHAQFRLLLAVQELGGAGGIPPSVLAEHLLIERGTVSVLTNRMVERGWLARLPGPNRRTFRLVLTPEGAALLQEVAPAAEALGDQAMAALPEGNLRQLAANLQLVEASLRSYKRGPRS